MPPSLEDTIAILSEIWNTNAAIPGNEYVLERIHAYVKTQLPQSIKNYQNAQSERETRKKSLALTADEITETFLNKTKYFYCAASELYFTYNNQVRYSLIHEDEIHHRILSFTSSTPSTFGASVDSVTISAPVSEASCTSGANGASVLISAPVSEASGANGASASSSVASYGGAVGGANIISASANGGASASTSASISTSVSTSISTSIRYKIKSKIIKSIQSRDILSSIPESHTIQNVIAMLCPALFRTRDHAKYFLTILGDILLKKSASASALVYFIPPVAKELIKELGGECYALFGSGSSAFTTAFKFKYYEHQYKDCRIVDIHAGAMGGGGGGGGGINVSFITPTTGALFRSSCLRLSHMPDLKSDVIDVCCVAAHYSHRFGSADDFLRLHCKTPEVATHALYLRDRTDPQIIQEFIDYATEPASADHEISMTNMLYLWKMYLSEFRLPAMFFAATLRAKLAEYACAAGVGGGGDAFPHRTSRYLPVVSQFRQFWSEHCVVNDTEIELEIDELSTLFKDYAAPLGSANLASASASDATLLGILRHFYPDVIIEDDKYILNVGCALWNKNAEINEYLLQFKDQCVSLNLSFPQPLYNAYEYYCGKCYLAAKRRIISKRYFEKYFVEEYAEYLDDNGMITIKWWVTGDADYGDANADVTDDDDATALS
jgi:hypothetical protein